MNNFGTSPYGAATSSNYFQQPNSYTPSTSPYSNPLAQQQVNLQALMNNTPNQQMQQPQQDNYVSKEDYDKLLMNQRFSGRAKMRRRLKEYLKDFKDQHL